MKQVKKFKIVLTGGHAATTALSTIEELSKRGVWEYSWIGSSLAMEGRKIKTLEAKTFEKYDIPTFSLYSGRLQRKFSFWTIPSLVKIPIGFIHAFILLRKISPDIILSFGGSSAFVVGIVGWILNIPLVIHEQTACVGRSNKLLARFATKIAISKNESAKFFPLEKVVLTGNPIRKIFFQTKKRKKEKQPVIFVFCGSRGATAVNALVSEILEKLLVRFKVIHHTGSVDFNHFRKVKEKLNKKLSVNYEVHEFIDPEQVPDYYAKADFVIARAGANTVSEIIAMGKPAIFIPLPWNYLDEQTQNAKYASNFVKTIIIDQISATPSKLYSAIVSINSKEKISNKKLSNPDVGAAERLADLVEEVAREK